MKILICEDDSLNLRFNKAFVEDYLEKRKIQNADILLKRKIDPKMLQEDITNVDIALLDIDLQDSVNGIEIANMLKVRNPYIVLIFITSYDNYALDAFKVKALGFLTKPVNAKDFNEIFTKAVLQINGLHSLKLNRLIEFGSKVSLREKSIYCIEKVEGTKDISITTHKQVLEVRGTIKEAQEKLSDSFVRINRTVIVNINYVYRVEGRILELSNEKIFTIAANRVKGLREAIHKEV